MVIKIIPEQSNLILPYAIGREIRSWFYNLISRRNSLLSDRLHEGQGIKPFTVSLLAGKRKDLGDRMMLYENNTYWLRLTTLKKELFEIISKELFSIFASGETIKFYDKELSIKQVCISPEEHPMADISTYKDLKVHKIKKNFTLNFKTPSAFVYGNGSMPLPLPYSIFRSYLKKWNAFCSSDYHIKEDILKIIEQSVFPGRYSLSTRVLDMKDFKMVGFIGNCNFEIIKDVSEKDLNHILTLVKFSFYGGTGTKTTIGMGQTVPDIY